MEENIEAEDPYHIVNTEFNVGKDSVYSLVSMTKRPNNSEKVKIYYIVKKHLKNYSINSI